LFPHQANKNYNLHFEVKLKPINFLKNTPENKLTCNMKYKKNNFSDSSQLITKPVNRYVNYKFQCSHFHIQKSTLKVHKAGSSETLLISTRLQDGTFQMHTLLKIQEPPQNKRSHKSDIKQVSYCHKH